MTFTNCIASVIDKCVSIVADSLEFVTQMCQPKTKDYYTTIITTGTNTCVLRTRLLARKESILLHFDITACVLNRE